MDEVLAHLQKPADSPDEKRNARTQSSEQDAVVKSQTPPVVLEKTKDSFSCFSLATLFSDGEPERRAASVFLFKLVNGRVLYAIYNKRVKEPVEAESIAAASREFFQLLHLSVSAPTGRAVQAVNRIAPWVLLIAGGGALLMLPAFFLVRRMRNQRP